MKNIAIALMALVSFSSFAQSIDYNCKGYKKGNLELQFQGNLESDLDGKTIVNRAYRKQQAIRLESHFFEDGASVLVSDVILEKNSKSGTAYGLKFITNYKELKSAGLVRLSEDDSSATIILPKTKANLVIKCSLNLKSEE